MIALVLIVKRISVLFLEIYTRESDNNKWKSKESLLC